MTSGPPIVEIKGVRKNYSALRPLRMNSLVVAPAERVAVAGLDSTAAELVVNLVTGATLPDEGEIQVFGRRTADVVDGEAWLASLDRFGIVSDRAVLLEGSTLVQNITLPFTLEIDPVSPEMRAQVVGLATECGIENEWLEQPAAALPPGVRARVHFARAIALGPALLLMEHPTAALPQGERGAFGQVVVRVCDARGLTTVMMTNDAEFAEIAAHRIVTLQPATGELAPKKRRWLKF
jgi:ABC-type transporter Mla maintaining outer membrane lipid asymmetry ATPase subunit MlaF